MDGSVYQSMSSAVGADILARGRGFQSRYQSRYKYISVVSILAVYGSQALYRP
jgi:hypothetical protein